VIVDSDTSTVAEKTAIGGSSMGFLVDKCSLLSFVRQAEVEFAYLDCVLSMLFRTRSDNKVFMRMNASHLGR
jgi:hypothetical protein